MSATAISNDESNKSSQSTKPSPVPRPTLSPQNASSSSQANGATRKRRESSTSGVRAAFNTLRRGLTSLTGQQNGTPNEPISPPTNEAPPPKKSVKKKASPDDRPTINVFDSDKQPLSEPIVPHVGESPQSTPGLGTPSDSRVNLVVDDTDRGRANGRTDPTGAKSAPMRHAGSAPPSGAPAHFVRARSSTSPIPDHIAGIPKHVHKRLILCCDGTWYDGIAERRRWRYSNVLKLSRCIDHEDARSNPPIPQILFYQSGLGSQSEFLGRLVDGAFGAHLADKVQEAYAWIAHNYTEGDEIFLFGFSRGAYTARMVAQFIGELGLLSRSEMDNFSEIFIAYQKRCRAATKPGEKERHDRVLEKYMKVDAYGKKKFDHYKFPIKVVGVFDTVGSFGVPSEFTINPKMETLFPLPDTMLGTHIERAYHAVALNEERADFNVTKFIQSEKGKAKGQVLRQMWFAGSHSDVGGGFQDHDLSDVALIWMVAEIEDVLAINMKYFKDLPKPMKQWGKQGPHDSRVGLFALGNRIRREIEDINPDTSEKIHLSVLEQLPENGVMPYVLELIQRNPNVVERTLLPLELEMRTLWKYTPGETPDRQDTARAEEERKREEKLLKSIQEASKKAAKKGKEAAKEGGRAAMEGGRAAKSKIIEIKNRALGVDEREPSQESAGTSDFAASEDEGAQILEQESQVADEPLSLLRTTTHYEESSVAPIWNEIVHGSDSSVERS